MIPPEELRHVLDGPRIDEQATGVGLVTVTFEAVSVADVLRRSKQVMAAVLQVPAQRWPALPEWVDQLPPWFVQRCADEPSEEEAQRWIKRWRELGLEARSQAEDEQDWTLKNWLSWLEPDERDWYWWDAADEQGSGAVVVEIPGWPAPVGALRWLLRAAGATSSDAVAR